MKTPNLHKSLNIVIRLVIVALSIGFIYWKVFETGDPKGLVKSVKSIGEAQGYLPGLVLVVIMMMVNWSVETIKWQQLIRNIEKISFYKAAQSVLSGITVSIFTPNRTGEFIGRAFILKNNETGKAVLLTIIGSLSQLLVTILFGTIALAGSYEDYLPANTIIPGWAHAGLITGIVLLNLALVSFFFNVPVFGLSIKNVFKKEDSKVITYLKFISTIDRKQLFLILILSIARYLIFSVQFYLMFQLFGIHLPLNRAIYIIPLIYFALAVIPTFALSELGVRGSVSLFLIGSYYLSTSGANLSEQDALAIVLAAGALWVINLAVPAIVGIPFVFKLKFFRR